MDRLKNVETGIARLSVWIDAPNAGRDQLAQLLFRVGKLTEEAGEVWDALIGVTGQNPRKGVYKTWDDVDKELLDTIVTAWGALEHRHGNVGVVADMLHSFVGGLLQRAGLQPTGGPTVYEGESVRVLAWDERDTRHIVAPTTPYVGETVYLGTKLYAGQPSVNIGPETVFAAAWEVVESPPDERE